MRSSVRANLLILRQDKNRSMTLLRDVPGAYHASFMTSLPARKPNVREKTQLMSASEIERTLVRLAHEIIEKSNGSEDLGLVGIKRRGVPLAQRLGKTIGRIGQNPGPVGTIAHK